MTSCPKCNTENPSGAKFCENCGNVLNKPKPKEYQTIDLNFCPDCGKPIELEADFCAHCGAAFGEPCPQCQVINQADAKFCEKCATPLNWICPICNNKNQAGALFCASCGSDSIIKKPIYKDPRYWSTAAIIIILLGTIFTKLNQFNNDLKNAIQNANNNKFDMAYQNIEEAENNWLPFTNAKANETRTYITDKEKKYKEEQAAQRKASEQNNSQASNSRNSSRNSNNRTQTQYYKSATINFDVGSQVTCIRKSKLNVTSLDYYNIGSNDFYHYATVASSSKNGIRGNYRFSWSLVDDCGITTPKPRDYKSYSGTFFLDGLHKVYYVTIYSDYLTVDGY